MFVLVTGAPGAGKTSHAIAHWMTEEKRPIYYRGIRDLTLPWTELSDEETLNWPGHLPDGAVLIVDEAQQLWPVRPASKPVPPGLTALETHRHRGWDVWFITQEPTLLDSHARKIANEHFHYVRPFGAPLAVEYHSGSGAISVSNRADLARCSQKKKRLPKKAWGAYKSAEVHTHKFRLPPIFIVLAVALVVGVIAWKMVFSNLAGEEGEASTAEAVRVAPGVSQSVASTPEKKSWTELLKPEIPSMPWTAPLYDDMARTPSAVPRLAGCVVRISTESCTCYTQQGTRIPGVSRDICETFMRDGMFNHLAQEGAARQGMGGAADHPGARSPAVQDGSHAVLLRDSTPRASRTL